MPDDWRDDDDDGEREKQPVGSGFECTCSLCECRAVVMVGVICAECAMGAHQG